MRTLAWLAVLAFASPAVAQPPPPPPPLPDDGGAGAAPADTAVVLPNMVPARGGATLDIRLDYTSIDTGDFFGEDLFLLGGNFYGQYLAPEGYGGYAQFPFFYASVNDESESGAGNLELGGLYSMPQGPASQLLLRGGIALDTAGQVGSGLAPAAQLAPRLYDALVAGGETTWLRAEVSFRHASGNLHLGASGGFDFPFDSDELDGIAKLAVSIGIDAGNGGVALGYTMLQAVGTDDDDDNISGLNLLGSLPVGPKTSMYVAFGLPDLENNLDEFDIFSIGAGVVIAATP